MRKHQIDRKIKELWDNFGLYNTIGGGVVSDIEKWLRNILAKEVIDKKNIEDPLKIVLDFVERWNKQDKEKEVAEAADKLERLI